MTDSGKKRKPADKQQADRKKKDAKNPKGDGKTGKGTRGPRTDRRSAALVRDWAGQS